MHSSLDESAYNTLSSHFDDGFQIVEVEQAEWTDTARPHDASGTFQVGPTVKRAQVPPKTANHTTTASIALTSLSIWFPTNTRSAWLIGHGSRRGDCCRSPS